MTQAVSSPHYTADIQGYSRDLVDGVTYFKVLVTENGARQWFVGRRYTDFERLAEGLRLLLPGMPPMPPKSFFRRNFLPSFMSERQLALGNLLRHALRADPTLSCLPPLRQFLQDAATAPGGAAGAVQMQPAYSVPAYAQAAAPPLAPYAAPAAPAHLAPQAAPVMQGTPVAQAGGYAHAAPVQPAYAAPQPAYAAPHPAYAAPQPAYAQAVPVQQASPVPGYSPSAYTQPQPGYAQPGYAQPGYAQPGYAQPIQQQPGWSQPAYGQPAYGQPAYPQPGFAQPGYEQPYHEEQPSHSGGMGKVVGVGVAAGAAGLVGGMLLEGALESHRRHESDAMFRDGGFPPLPGGPGFFGGPGLFGSEEVRTEVIDRDMFGRVEDVRETIVDRDAFGDITREEVIVDDGW
mmetsp:Transcript_85492/g.207211  ORF Transcript_85492/g.207211 Transcript_85492/m.207211 type:complete len:403 (-) Transcript_85492:204-1412(-)